MFVANDLIQRSKKFDFDKEFAKVMPGAINHIFMNKDLGPEIEK